MTISSSSCGDAGTNHDTYMNALKDAAQERQQQQPAVIPPAPVQPAQPGSLLLDIKA